MTVIFSFTSSLESHNLTHSFSFSLACQNFKIFMKFFTDLHEKYILISNSIIIYSLINSFQFQWIGFVFLKSGIVKMFQFEIFCKVANIYKFCYVGNLYLYYTNYITHNIINNCSQTLNILYYIVVNNISSTNNYAELWNNSTVHSL